MDLLQLRYFIAVAETEHVTHAAESLNVAQPALTKTIKNLKRNRISAFERKGRGITLSKCGKYLYDYVAEAVKVIERAPGAVARFASDIKDVVKLNVLAASDCVTTAIIDYKKVTPATWCFPSCRTTRFPMRILRYIPTQKGQTARTSLIFAKILCLPSPKRRIIRA